MTLKPTYPDIFTIPAYKPGKSAIAGVVKPIKLSSNENSFGPSPKVLEAAKKSIETMHRYADGAAVNIREALAKHYGVNADAIVCGAGSDDILYLLTEAYAGPDKTVLYSQHGFLVYPLAALRIGAKPIKVEEKELTADVDGFINAVDDSTAIIFIANPNNPTGTYLPKSEVVRLLDNVPSNVLVVLDEAYYEYATAEDYASGFELVSKYPNLVVTRTFSKIYGLASLRLGFGYMSLEVADVLNRIRGPFNVPGPAQVAGVAAIEDKAYIEQCIVHNTQWRERLSRELRDIGFEVVPSQANFVLAKPTDGGNAETVDEKLKAAGVIIRRVDAYGLPDYVRITIGTDEEMLKLLEALSA